MAARVIAGVLTPLVTHSAVGGLTENRSWP